MRAENDKTFTSFTHVAINIKQKEDLSISIDQHMHAESLKTIPMNKEQLSDPLPRYVWLKDTCIAWYKHLSKKMKNRKQSMYIHYSLSQICYSIRKSCED